MIEMNIASMTHEQQVAAVTEAFWRDRAPIEWLPESDEIAAAYAVTEERPLGDVASLPREEQVAVIREAYWHGRAPELTTHPWLDAASRILAEQTTIANLKAA
jgi:hypothetical protein